MRIFVFEYLTGGGLAGQPLDSDLAQEGELMLTALIEDLLDCSNVQVSTARDTRLAGLDFDLNVFPVSNQEEMLRVWSRGVRNAEAVWPIAPETNGALEFLSGWVELAGRMLLTSRPHAIRIAASKWATARRLAERGLPVVPTWNVKERIPIGDSPWVLKPDQGVGCCGTRLIRGHESLADAVVGLRPHEDWVVQPYLAGQPVSLSLLVDEVEVELLGCNLQRVVLRDDRFYLIGCEINGLGGDRSEYAQLGRDVVRALPGLWGYVGIDLVVIGGKPVILEVNPRLTTSYVGLSTSLGANVAAMVCDRAQGASRPPGTRRQPKRVDVDLEYCRIA